jgi:hypothetical protein
MSKINIKIASENVGIRIPPAYYAGGSSLCGSIFYVVGYHISSIMSRYIWLSSPVSE